MAVVKNFYLPYQYQQLAMIGEYLNNLTYPFNLYAQDKMTNPKL